MSICVNCLNTRTFTSSRKKIYSETVSALGNVEIRKLLLASEKTISIQDTFSPNFSKFSRSYECDKSLRPSSDAKPDWIEERCDHECRKERRNPSDDKPHWKDATCSYECDKSLRPSSDAKPDWTPERCNHECHKEKRNPSDDKPHWKITPARMNVTHH